jgi:hypothetical protein
MDQPAWRPHLSNALATGPKHLPLLSQVLSGKLRKVTSCPKKRGPHSDGPAHQILSGRRSSACGRTDRHLCTSSAGFRRRLPCMPMTKQEHARRHWINFAGAV